jgi:anti-anti-sigma factor
MSTLARVEDEWHDEVPVARLWGEIDSSNVDDIGDRLRKMVSNRSVALVIDLSEVTYVDSAGINLMFALGEDMRSHQQRLALVVRDGSPIERMFTVTGLDRAVGTHTSLDAALAAV